MSLDISLYQEQVVMAEVFDLNITHNLAEMARECGLYEAMWRPELLAAERAKDLIEPLTDGLNTLRRYPERFKEFNPSNGWGSYENLVECAQSYLHACMENPNAEIQTSR